ncbi:MAG: hypothetical protein J7L26_00455 [Candidatus Aminicenantes bacterium]|nr:hypothetical protein [Candidatus Aminicenantes bacterium]
MIEYRFNLKEYLREKRWRVGKLGEKIAITFLNYLTDLIKERYHLLDFGSVQVVDSNDFRQFLREYMRINEECGALDCIDLLKNIINSENYRKDYERILENAKRDFSKLFNGELKISYEKVRDLSHYEIHTSCLVKTYLEIQIMNKYNLNHIHLIYFFRNLEEVLKDLIDRNCRYFDAEEGTCKIHNIKNCSYLSKIKKADLNELYEKLLRSTILKMLISLLENYSIIHFKILNILIEKKKLYYILTRIFNFDPSKGIFLKPHPHLDFIGVDDQKNIWFFEVKATTGSRTIYLTKTEKKILEELESQDIKFGLVILRIEDDWNVSISLRTHYDIIRWPY